MEDLEDYTKIERIVECKRPLKHFKVSYKEHYDKMISDNGEDMDKYESTLKFGSKNNFKFYVKWRSINYDRCTWEDEFIVYKYRDLLKKFMGNKIVEESVHDPQQFKKAKMELKEVKYNKYADQMKKQ